MIEALGIFFLFCAIACFTIVVTPIISELRYMWEHPDA